MRDAEAAKHFFLKALHSTAGSTPRVRPVQEQVEEPPAVADPITSTPASPVEESTALADPSPTKSAPRVINVDKNAAYPKAIAELKASGVLAEAVELKPGQIPQ